MAAVKVRSYVLYEGWQADTRPVGRTWSGGWRLPITDSARSARPFVDADPVAGGSHRTEDEDDIAGGPDGRVGAGMRCLGPALRREETWRSGW